MCKHTSYGYAKTFTIYGCSSKHHTDVRNNYNIRMFTLYNLPHTDVLSDSVRMSYTLLQYTDVHPTTYGLDNIRI